MNTGKVAIVGAGFSGAVVARTLADAGFASEVFDARSHVAGNCHTDRGPSGILEHVYGPHIFHTDRTEVWDYVRRFADFDPYVHRVKATTARGVFSLPINLLTLNQLTGQTMSPSEAQQYLERQAASSGVDHEPRTFEEQALRTVGRELYETFFRGYTVKQWGRDPSELPASVLKRLPIRFNYDDAYFGHPFQGIPRGGYTELVRKILDHPLIDVQLGVAVGRGDLHGFSHVVWTGPIDGYHDYCLGRLPYRTLTFERIEHEGDHQGCSMMNYCEEQVPFTRVTEHKHFAPWEQHRSTVVYREYSAEAGETDIPYYPVRLADDERLLGEYVQLARSARRVTFVGRLGTYRYLDMDVTIAEAMEAGARLCRALGTADGTVPSFLRDPLG